MREQKQTETKQRKSAMDPALPYSPPTLVLARTTGADEAGLEAELAYAITPSWEIFASLGLLDTQFEDFINSAGEDLLILSARDVLAVVK